MLDCALSYLLIKMAQAAEAVTLLLKEIGIDCANTQAKSIGIILHCLPIVFPIPGYVNGDAWADARDLVDLGRVCQLFAQGAGRSWPMKHLEARARIAITPRGRFDGDALDFSYNGVVIDV